MKQKKLIAIGGATGAGKTALAVSIAKRFNGVIVSADSRQVYCGLNVGTNKEGVPGQWQDQPTRLVDGVPQLLVDIIEPGARFTLSDWLSAAQVALELIWRNGQLPIICGGTGLYITGLIEGYKPGSGRFAKDRLPVDFQSLLLLKDVDRELLYQRSNERFPKIFDALVVETQKLLAAGVSADWLETIGLDYRSAARYLKGEVSRETAISMYQVAGRAYIRRQLTWWRHHGKPLAVATTEEAAALVEKFLEES